MKFDISALLVKSKEYDSKINTNVSDISSNLSKIETLFDTLFIVVLGYVVLFLALPNLFT